MWEYVLMGAKVVDSLLDKEICGICGKEKCREVSIASASKTIPEAMLTYWKEKDLMRTIMGKACSEEDLTRIYGTCVRYGDDHLPTYNKTRICKSCLNQRLKPLVSNFERTYASMNTVETYPATYKKPIPLNTAVSPKVVTYAMDGGKWNTVNKMKFYAAHDGYDVSYNITYNYDTHKVTGVFARKR